MGDTVQRVATRRQYPSGETNTLRNADKVTRIPDTLPAPDADAQAHSAELAAAIRQEIRGAGGSIPFSRFMELCLYAPGLGYYSAGATKFGGAGDFVTAPELGHLFAECVGEAILPVLGALEESSILEIGGGTGAFAGDLLRHLQASNRLPARYCLLEPSAQLRQRQREHLQAVLPPEIFARVEWLDRPFEQPWNGVVFANEVLDALPTTRFAIAEEEVWEDHVALDKKDAFVVIGRPADALVTASVRHVERALDHPFAEDYRSELLPQLPYWVQAVIGPMQRGVLLFVDYGYGRGEYYQPQRGDGTLRAFRRHHVVDDVLAWPGLQDITASIDFTALAEAGTGAGFDLAGYCSQASFLIGNGLDRRLVAAEAQAADEVARLRLRQQVKRLTMPEEMGERFQVMGFARDVEFGHAFLIGDLAYRL
ncbi:MAG: SAM-dependent methyltransferase [Xanthomonadales bacterium]|nr:SAM-dependent methyltransferase [Xanthomonadales bacterium]